MNINTSLDKLEDLFMAISLNIAAKNADMIFQNWFGMLDEERKCYTDFTQDDFADVFPIFIKKDCECLLFIMTQYLWFYGMNSGC